MLIRLYTERLPEKKDKVHTSSTKCMLCVVRCGSGSVVDGCCCCGGVGDGVGACCWVVGGAHVPMC